MAQKRRGLGRGLQALIPDAQKETVGSGRPSDVFFPDAREDEDSVADAEGSVLGHTDSLEGAKATAGRGIVADTEVDSSVGSGDTALSESSTKRLSHADSLRDVDSDTSNSAVRSGGRGPAGRQVRSGTKSVRQRRRSDRAKERTEEGSHNSSSDRSDKGSSEFSSSWREETSSFKHVADEKASQVFRDGDGSQTDNRRTSEQQGDHVDSGRDSVHAGSHASQEGELVPVPGASFAEIPLELISPNPRQPRQVFDEEEITELAASIVEVGLLQPIVVRRVPVQEGQEQDRFELILGERRLRAAKEALLDTVPAVVRDTDDVDMLRNALLENLHRVQLNPLEEAAAYQQLLEDFDCTQAELSERIARSRSQISNTLRLMKLPPLVQRRLAAGVLSAGHARALLGLSHVDVMERMAQKIVAEGLSVRATEEMVALHEESDSSRQQPNKLRSRSTPLPELSTRLSDVFDTRVKVTKGAKKGRITIEFAGDDDLARIVRTLAPGTSVDGE